MSSPWKWVANCLSEMKLFRLFNNFIQSSLSNTWAKGAEWELALNSVAMDSHSRSAAMSGCIQASAWHRALPLNLKGSVCYSLAIKAHVVAKRWQEGICLREDSEAWSTTLRACRWADALALVVDRRLKPCIWLATCAQSCAEAKAWQQVLALASGDVDAALAGIALSVAPKPLELLEVFRRQWIKGLEWPASSASLASSKAGRLGAHQDRSVQV